MSSAADRLSPRIYVACLAAYNAGHLHGAWIDVEDKEAIKDAITAMLSASPIAGAEEFAIHDYDGFGGVNIGEYEPIGRIVEIACFLRERGRLGALLLNHVGGNIDEAIATLDDGHQGAYESLADYFEEFTEETVEIPAPPTALHRLRSHGERRRTQRRGLHAPDGSRRDSRVSGPVRPAASRRGPCLGFPP